MSGDPPPKKELGHTGRGATPAAQSDQRRIHRHLSPLISGGRDNPQERRLLQFAPVDVFSNVVALRFLER